MWTYDSNYRKKNMVYFFLFRCKYILSCIFFNDLNYLASANLTSYSLIGGERWPISEQDTNTRGGERWPISEQA